MEIITSGYTRNCKDSLGGLDNIYLFTFENYSRSQIVINGNKVVTFPATTIYSYEAVNNPVFDNKQNDDNDSIYYDESLSFQLAKVNDNYQVSKLLKKDVRAIVKDRNGKYRILGLYNGLECESINADIGSSKGSFNGYSIKLSGKEEKETFYIDNLESAGFTIDNTPPVRDFLSRIIHYWKYNLSNADSANAPNTPGIFTSVTYESGLIDNCAKLGNFTNSKITVFDDPSLSYISQDFTWITLFKANSFANNPRIFEKRDASFSEYRGLIIASNKARTALVDNLNTGQIARENTTALSTGVWYVVTTTFNFSTKEMVIYIDNNSTNIDLNSGTYVDMANTTADVTIGKDATNTANTFDGLINARIDFDIALTPTEIAYCVNELKVLNQHLI